MIREWCSTKDHRKINANSVGTVVRHGLNTLPLDGKNQQLATPRVVSTVYTTTALNTEHVLGATTNWTSGKTNYKGSVKTFMRPKIQLVTR